jgi:hypothetical protein
MSFNKVREQHVQCPKADTNTKSFFLVLFYTRAEKRMKDSTNFLMLHYAS